MTSVMVDWIDDSQSDQVKKLIELTKEHNISVGLHIDFKSEDFDAEIKRQNELFENLFDFKPVHIDLHKSVYLSDGYPYIIEFSKANNIPCKNLGVEPITKLMTKSEVFSGTKKDITEIENWLSSLDDELYHTIIFHPGYYDPNSKSSFNEIREVDAENIVELNGVLDNYDTKLVSYADFMKNQ